MKKIFNILFGTSRNQSSQTKVSNIKFPETNLKLNFLRRVKGMDFEFDFNDLGYEKYFEDCNLLIQEFLREGLIRESEFEEKLNLNELKELLKKNHLPASGNKKDLINTLKENVNPRSYRPEKYKKFITLTELGQKTLNEYEKNFELEFRNFQDQILLKILNNELGEAKKLVLHFNKSQESKSSFFLNESESFAKRKTMLIEYFYKGPEFLNNLNLDQEQKTILGKYFACYAMFKNGFIEFDILGNIENEFYNFHPTQVVDFLKNEPYGTFFKKKFNDKKDIIEVFVSYEYSYADNKIRLQDIMMNENKDRYRGVQILSGGCEKCKEFELELVNWKDLNKISLLPRYPGCSCLYSIA